MFGKQGWAFRADFGSTGGCCAPRSLVPNPRHFLELAVAIPLPTLVGDHVRAHGRPASVPMAGGMCVSAEGGVVSVAFVRVECL